MTDEEQGMTDEEQGITDEEQTVPDEQSEFEQSVRWLEQLTGDPMADAVRGRLTVLSASEPTGRARYQECRLELTAEAPGIAPVAVPYVAVFARRQWPRAGMVVPALISRTDPRVFDANWEALSRSAS